ncbi:MAG: alpha/beta hydrolase fold domain-containing protein [Solirubrobacteraceae bacterium]
MTIAAPARATDLSGLPRRTSPALDPNRDEAITYALRLLQAGVPVELHQWPGTFHGSQAILSAEVSQRQMAELGVALRRALAGDVVAADQAGHPHLPDMSDTNEHP